MRKLYIKTYGCQMNIYDSEKMSDQILDLGYVITNNSYDADLIILNTCHIRHKAVEKTFSDLGRIKKDFENNYSKKNKPTVVVAGCVAQAQGKEILKRSPWVDIVVGPQSYTELPDMIKKVKSLQKKQSININFPTIPKFDHLNHGLIKNKITSYVTIQEGCDKFCSFCVVPYTRGPEYSRSIESIMLEIENLILKGVREIVLLGQNVNAWKCLSKNGDMWSFGNLIEKISSFDDIISIRYTTSHPLDVDLDLLKAHKNIPKLMPFLHLPIQSGSNNILKKMNRKHTVDDYLEIIDLVRKYKPDIAISSDFIVGFPGETEEDHKATLKLIKKVQFSNSYSFKYSPRPGTPSSLLENSICDEIKTQRLNEIQKLLKDSQLLFNQDKVNKLMNVLIIGKNKKNQYYGKSPYNQSIFIENNYINHNHFKITTGDLIKVRIKNSFQNSLVGQPVSIFKKTG